MTSEAAARIAPPTSRFDLSLTLVDAIEMPTRQRQGGEGGRAFARQQLVHPDFARLELERTRSHLEAPATVGRLLDMFQGFIVMSFETVHPAPERQRVVRTQRLHVGNLEAAALHAAQDVADRVELAIRKDVAVDEFGRERVVEMDRVPVLVPGVRRDRQALRRRDAVDGLRPYLRGEVPEATLPAGPAMTT